MAGAYFIEVDRLRPDPAQPRRRLDTAAQEELVRSVSRFGVMQPISVRYLEAQQTYQIISDDRRRGTVTTIRRFNTTSALVTVTFRKRAVDDADLATALDEARARVDAPPRSTRGESTQPVEPQT